MWEPPIRFLTYCSFLACQQILLLCETFSSFSFKIHSLMIMTWPQTTFIMGFNSQTHQRQTTLLFNPREDDVHSPLSGPQWAKSCTQAVCIKVGDVCHSPTMWARTSQFCFSLFLSLYSPSWKMYRPLLICRTPKQLLWTAFSPTSSVFVRDLSLLPYSITIFPAVHHEWFFMEMYYMHSVYRNHSYLFKTMKNTQYIFPDSFIFLLLAHAKRRV